jgi:hypothetical protein
MPLLKRTRRQIWRHSRWGDCPCALGFLKAAPGSRFQKRRERAGSPLAPEPGRLAGIRRFSPASRESFPVPRFFVANAIGSPKRLFYLSVSPSSPALYLFLSLSRRRRLQLRYTRLSQGVRERKSLSLKKKKKLIQAPSTSAIKT